LRTTLQFAALGQQIRSLVITSSRPGDGKTTLIANLGAVLAQGGQRVVLLDADLRKPRLHTYFDGVSNPTGLTSLLLAEPDVGFESLLQPTEISGLRVLTTGPLPPNPADVLNSPRMQEIVTQLEKTGDILLIDSPPMAVSDALVISDLVDGVVLVTTGNRTRSAELTRMVQEFTRTSTPLVSVVINRADTKSEGYYSYYRSYYDAEVERPAPQTNGTTAEPDGQRSAGERPARRLRDSGN
jgi:polysaccharide biosynthesis transport protein